jgi:phosphohistidine phosphatase SixA
MSAERRMGIDEIPFVDNAEPPQVESKEVEPRGRNVLVSIDLIRHPEKDPKTGKLTQKGKDEFFYQLSQDFGAQDQYDTVKFYVSPLSRGQEAKEPINDFLAEAKINTRIRTKKELAGRFNEVGPEFKKEMTAILERNATLTKQQIDEARERDRSIPAYEPASKDFEIGSNEILIRDFFQDKFPASEISGKDIAEEQKKLIDHFAKLATRLKSGSKVKLVVVGHSGLIEHLTKLVYLQNHPEVDPKEVDLEMIRGLVDFSDGPEITINTDQEGGKKVNFKYKDLDLEYKS